MSYQMKRDMDFVRITSNPNRDDNPEYIVRLFGQVNHPSLETVKIVNSLPAL